MSQPLRPLLTSKEVSDLAQRAFALYDEVAPLFDTWREEPDDDAVLARDAAQAMLVACASCIAQLRDPALFELTMQIIDAVEDTDAFGGPREQATAGLRELARAGVALREIAEYADDGRAHVREAIAASYPVDTPDRLAVVLALAADEAPDVRASAKRRLEKVDVPFWLGKFSVDPFSVLTPAQAEALQEPIARICQVLDARYLDEAQQKALFADAALLPPRLQADVLGRAQLGGHLIYSLKNEVPRMLAKLGDDGARALEAIVLSPKMTSGEDLFAKEYGAALPPSDAPARLPGFLERACAATVDDAQRGSLAHCLACAAGAGWPPEADPTPVLDAILARPEWTPDDPVATGLSDAIARSRRFEVLRPRIEEALLAGFPDKWGEIAWDCKQLLQALPKRQLRAVVERTFDCESESAIAWGIEMLCGKAHDRKQDPPRRELALRLDDDPRCRRAMRLRHTAYVLPRLRAELVAGRLDFSVAARAVAEAGRMFGGTFSETEYVWTVVRGEKLHDAFAVGGNPMARDRFRRFLGPTKKAAGPTEDEWRAYRAARARHPFETDEDFALGLRALPYEEGWEASDRAFFERALARVRERRTGGTDSLIVLLGAAIAKKSGAADLPILDELSALADDDPADEDGDDADRLRAMQRVVRARLGLPELEEDAETADGDEDEEEDDEWLEQP